MLNAVISGVDGIALILDEDTQKFYLVRVDNWPIDSMPKEIPSLAYHMWMRQVAANPGNLRHETSVSTDQVIEFLKQEWTHDRIMRMIFIYDEEPDDIELRQEASEALKELLAEEQHQNWFASYPWWVRATSIVDNHKE